MKGMIKKVIRFGVIILAVVLVGGGSVGGAIYFGFLPDFIGLKAMLDGKPDDTPREATVVDRLGPPPYLLSMKPFEIPIIRDGRLQRRVNLRFRLQVDPERALEMNTAGHKLHGEMFRELMILVPQQLQKNDTLDLPAIADRMLVLAHRTIDPTLVKDVLVQGYFER